MNKQRKILITVAGLGLSSLAADRLLLGPPETASADQAEYVITDDSAPAEDTDKRPSDKGNAEQNALPSFATLTERMIASAGQGVGEPAPDHDPFSLPKAWEPERVEEVQVRPNQGDPGKSAELLLAQFRLDGTFRSVVDNQQDQLVAVINGRSMRVGWEVRVSLGSDRFEVFKLKKVGARTVLWESKETGLQVKMHAPEVLE